MAAPGLKPGGKGLPPAPVETHVVGNHTSKVEAGTKIPCNFRVDAEFKKDLKVFAAAHDMDMVEVFEEAVREYMNRKGSG